MGLFKTKTRGRGAIILAGAMALLFYVLLCLPFLQRSFSITPKLRLEGVGRVSLPAFTSEGFLNGDFQRGFERWLLTSNGFWGHLVRMDNQLNFELFQLSTANYDSKLIFGTDRWIYQRDYLKAFNREWQPETEYLEQVVANVAELQRRLADRGVKMLLIIGTNKPALYPDLVPEKLRRPHRLKQKSIYERMLPMISTGRN